MSEITIHIGLGKSNAGDLKNSAYGGVGSAPSACVILVPAEYSETIDDAIKCIYTSTDEEAVKTAENYAKKLKSPIEYKSKKLLHWDLGDLQGEPDSTLVSRLPFHVEWSPEGKVSGGESFNDFKKRFLRELEGILEESKRENSHILVVTHNICCKLTHAWFEEKSEQGDKEDEFYQVDGSDFIGDGFKTLMPIRICFDGQWECEEIGKKNGEDDD